MCDFSKQHDTNDTKRTNHLGSNCRCGRLKRFKIIEYVKRNNLKNHDDRQTEQPQDKQKDDGHELCLDGWIVQTEINETDSNEKVDGNVQISFP